MSDLVKQVSIKNSSGTEWETRDIGVDADNVEGLIDYINNSEDKISNLEPTDVVAGPYGEGAGQQSPPDAKTIAILDPSNQEDTQLTATRFSVENDGRLSAAKETSIYFKPTYIEDGLEITKGDYSDILKVKMSGDYDGSDTPSWDSDTLFTYDGARDLWDSYVNDHRGRKCYFGFCGSEANSTDKHVIIYNVDDPVFVDGTVIKILFENGSNVLNYLGYLTFAIHPNSISAQPIIDTSLVNAYTLRCDENTVLSFVYYDEHFYLDTPRPTYLIKKENLGGELSPVSANTYGYQIKTANHLEAVKIYKDNDSEHLDDKYGIIVPAGKGFLKVSFRTTATATPMQLLFGVSTSPNPDGFSRGSMADVYHSGTQTAIDTSDIGSFTNTLRYSSSDEIVLVVNNTEDTKYYLFAATSTIPQNEVGAWIYPEYSYFIVNRDHFS